MPSHGPAYSDCIGTVAVNGLSGMSCRISQLALSVTSEANASLYCTNAQQQPSGLCAYEVSAIGGSSRVHAVLLVARGAVQWRSRATPPDRARCSSSFSRRRRRSPCRPS